jgi:hypothetical protein
MTAKSIHAWSIACNRIQAIPYQDPRLRAGSRPVFSVFVILPKFFPHGLLHFHQDLPYLGQIA